MLTQQKVTNHKYLGQTISMETELDKKIRIKAGYREICLDRHLPMSLKRKVSNQCVLPGMTYGYQPWSHTKALVRKLLISQHAMEREMLNVKLIDRISNTIVRQRT